MTDSNTKGDRRERQLRNFYREMEGHVPLRMPASGSAIDMELPDLLVGVVHRDPLAIELKAGKPDLLYADSEEVADLRAFSEAFGSRSFLAGRWDGDSTFYLRHVSNVPTTDGGNYRLKRSDFVEDHDAKVEKPDS